MEEKTFAIYSLGCKVNQEEASALEGIFSEAGYRQVDFDAMASVYIINTCTVTSLADKKSRAMIRRAHKKNPEALVVVTGCYAQVSPTEVAAIEGVDLVLGVDERAGLLQLVESKRGQKKSLTEVKVSDVSRPHQFSALPAAKGMQRRARAFVKIQDGCNQFCHYCIIPYARGASRSLPMADVLERTKKLIELGHREIVLSGIHIGVYGEDLANGGTLYQLIREILKIHGLGRLHLGSLEVEHIDNELVELFVMDKRLCPHLHIPLQSGSDKVLSDMGRKYTAAQYRNLVERIRRDIPDISITTDVIVGYPGEGDREFKETVEFVQQMAFSKMHIFPYSPRRGTVAYDYQDQVSDQEKKRRAKELSVIDDEMQSAYGKNFIGRDLRMLKEQKTEVEGKSFWSGHSENYLQLLLPFCENEEKAEEDVIGVRWHRNCLYVKSRKNLINAEQ